MKIAVAAEGTGVSAHFGHCEGFFLYDMQAGDIVGQSYLANPGHRHGLLPRLLAEAKAEVVIAGGMGAGAIELLDDAGISVVTGASGDTAAAARDFAAGKLVSAGAVCHDHSHHDDCASHNG